MDRRQNNAGPWKGAKERRHGRDRRGHNRQAFIIVPPRTEKGWHALARDLKCILEDVFGYEAGTSLDRQKRGGRTGGKKVPGLVNNALAETLRGPNWNHSSLMIVLGVGAKNTVWEDLRVAIASSIATDARVIVVTDGTLPWAVKQEIIQSDEHQKEFDRVMHKDNFYFTKLRIVQFITRAVLKLDPTRQE